MKKIISTTLAVALAAGFSVTMLSACSAAYADAERLSAELSAAAALARESARDGSRGRRAHGRDGFGERRADGERSERGGRGRASTRWMLDENGAFLDEAAFVARMDRAVESGRITRERADRMIDRRGWMVDENDNPLGDEAFRARVEQAFIDGLITAEGKARMLNTRERRQTREGGRDRASRGWMVDESGAFVNDATFFARMDQAVATNQISEAQAMRMINRRHFMVDENGAFLSAEALAARLDQAVSEGLIDEERRARALNRHERRVSGEGRMARGESRGDFDGRGRRHGRGGGARLL